MTVPRCQNFGHHQLGGVWRNVQQDIGRFLNKSPENQLAGDTWKSRCGAFLTPELLCITVARLSHYLHVNGWPGCGAILSTLNCWIHRASISPASCIGPGLHLPHPPGVTFAGNAGAGLTLYSLAICCGDFPGSQAGVPTFGDGVSIAAHSVALGPIRAGDHVTLAPAVRLNRDAPDSVLVISRSVSPRQRSLREGPWQ